MELKIYDARKEDFEGIIPLLKQLWPNLKFDYNAMEKVFETYINSEGQKLIIGKVDNKIIGFCSLTIRNNFWQSGYLAHVDELVVDEKFRGYGFGKQLMQRITEIAKDKKCRQIELDSAFHRKEAHGFYESLGFEKLAYIFSRKIDN